MNILEVNSLSVVSFAVIFSHSEGIRLTLLIVSFIVQKLLSLIRSHLFIFVFISITLGGGSQRILLWFMLEGVLCFPLKWSEVKSLSRVWLFATPWTVAYQDSPSMGFSRQEYWSGLPFPSPGDLPDPGIEPRSPKLEADTSTSEPPGRPMFFFKSWKSEKLRK